MSVHARRDSCSVDSTCNRAIRPACRCAKFADAREVRLPLRIMTPSTSRALVRALVAASAVMAVGCADNSASVEIRQLMLPQANPTLPGACSLSNDPSSPKLLASVLDLALRDNYVAFPLVQNNMFGNRSGELNRPDQRAIMGQYVDVELTTLAGALLSLGATPSSYRVPISSDVIPAGSASAPSFGVIEVSAITAAQGQALRDRLGCTGFAAGAPPAPFCARTSETIQVTLRPTFRTVGGVELTSAVGAVWKNVAPYTFPLTICCGCLLQIPTGYNEACMSLSSTATTPASSLSYCLAGQDLPLSCLACGGGPECSRSGC